MFSFKFGNDIPRKAVKTHFPKFMFSVDKAVDFLHFFAVTVIAITVGYAVFCKIGIDSAQYKGGAINAQMTNCSLAVRKHINGGFLQVIHSRRASDSPPALLIMQFFEPFCIYGRGIWISTKHPKKLFGNRRTSLRRGIQSLTIPYRRVINKNTICPVSFAISSKNFFTRRGVLPRATPFFPLEFASRESNGLCYRKSFLSAQADSSRCARYYDDFVFHF